MNKDLTLVYKAWREVSEEMINDGMVGTTDCGEQSVREDFTTYAILDNEITFDEMLKLEREYETNN